MFSDTNTTFLDNYEILSRRMLTEHHVSSSAKAVDLSIIVNQNWALTLKNLFSKIRSLR